MKLRLWVLGIVMVIFCIPYVRCFFKRLSLLAKLKNICREKGYRLDGTHFLWFLGGKEGEKFDCLIETAEELLAVKLFGMPRRKRVLVFTGKREFFIRLIMVLIEGRLFFVIRQVFDGKAKPLPKYEFSMEDKDFCYSKRLRKILLVNPVPMEMLFRADNSKESILNPGDELFDMEVANLSWFLKELKK